MSVLPDHRLVGRYLRERSEEAFTALYEAHAPAMYALACHLCGRSGDAEDVLQEAWVRALRRLNGFRWESSLRTWLCGFVVNCCRERFRLRLREAVAIDPPAASTQHAGPLDVERAVAALPPRYRAVVVLHDIAGYTHEEIGRLLEIDAGTSKSQLSRARRVLRGMLAPSTGDVR